MLIPCTTFVVLGHVAGSSYQQLEHSVGRGTALAAAALIVVALVVWRVSSGIRERREEREGEGRAPQRTDTAD